MAQASSTLEGRKRRARGPGGRAKRARPAAGGGSAAAPGPGCSRCRFSRRGCGRCKREAGGADGPQPQRRAGGAPTAAGAPGGRFRPAEAPLDTPTRTVAGPSGAGRRAERVTPLATRPAAGAAAAGGGAEPPEAPRKRPPAAQPRDPAAPQPRRLLVWGQAAPAAAPAPAAPPQTAGRGLAGALRALRAQRTARVAPHLAKAFQNLNQLVDATVRFGANGSAVLVGPPGCGKSVLVQQVVRRARAEYNKEGDTPTVGVVRLSGILHADDKAAVRHIASQLCAIWNCKFSKGASFSENLAFLREMVQELHKSHKSVIFVLEEFDLFLQKQKQTLIYNLLDLVHSSKVQATILGVSCRHDVVELMEKRSRSRFSHRKVVLPAPTDAQALDLMEAAARLPAAHPASEFKDAFNRAVGATFAAALTKSLVAREMRVLCSLRHLAQIVAGALALLETADPFLCPEKIEQAVRELMPRPKFEVVPALSPLETVLLIAMQRLEKGDRAPYNFHEVFAEYVQATKLAPDQWHGLRFGFATAMTAFERVLELGLAVPAEGRHSNHLKGYRPVRIVVARGDLLRAVHENKALPEAISHWLERD